VRCVFTLVWYAWTATAPGPAQTPGVFRTLDLSMDDAPFGRLPEVGETLFFEDGGAARIEAIGWKLDGAAYLYLGQRFEKDGEAIATWQARGFVDRYPVPAPAPQQAQAPASAPPPTATPSPSPAAAPAPPPTPPAAAPAPVAPPPPPPPPPAAG
jgi:hypothetical protein